MILDFEGEPARPLPERRRKRSPLRDVAGMLRSFAYAASAAEQQRGTARAGGLGGARARGVPRGLLRDASTRACSRPARTRSTSCSSVFELEKAVYELRYELNNRPDWVGIPVAGIVRLLDSDLRRRWPPSRSSARRRGPSHRQRRRAHGRASDSRCGATGSGGRSLRGCLHSRPRHGRHGMPRCRARARPAGAAAQQRALADPAPRRRRPEAPGRAARRRRLLRGPVDAGELRLAPQQVHGCESLARRPHSVVSAPGSVRTSGVTDAEQLAARSAADPHSFLGAHPDGNGGVVVRAFRPAARAVRVLTADGPRTELARRAPGRRVRGHGSPAPSCRSTTSSRSTTARTARSRSATRTASCRRSARSTCTSPARAATRSSTPSSARTCSSTRACAGTAFAVWAPSAALGLRRRRLQLLGRPPAPDALARLERDLGAVPARRRVRAPATSTRSSRRRARSG